MAPDWRARVEDIWDKAPFVTHLGITLEHLEPGRCESALVVRPEMLQQNGYVHAGVLTTVADHTAGAAAGTLMPPEHALLSLEFKMHLLRPALGKALRCTAIVLKPGRQFSVVEAEVYTSDKLVAKLVGTMVYRP